MSNTHDLFVYIVSMGVASSVNGFKDEGNASRSQGSPLINPSTYTTAAILNFNEFLVYCLSAVGFLGHTKTNKKYWYWRKAHGLLNSPPPREIGKSTRCHGNAEMC